MDKTYFREFPLTLRIYRSKKKVRNYLHHLEKFMNIYLFVFFTKKQKVKKVVVQSTDTFDLIIMYCKMIYLHLMD